MVTQLRDGVWWIDLRGVNAYLADDDGELTLVDAGMPWQGGDVVDAIVEAGFVLGDLDRVFLTHYDPDHVGGLPRLDGLDLTIYAGQDDAPLVAGDASLPLDSSKGVLQRAFGPLVEPPDNEVVPLTDGDTVGSFTVYETPGHTPGHVVYVSESLGVAFLGDLVGERDGRLRDLPWFMAANAGQARDSVRRFASRAPPFDIAAPGHGVPFQRAGSEKLTRLVETL